ncbi:TRAP transporter large permease [Paenibacillus xerothermodurans]|uniref:L-dehydroascorbate transporter large permease subunit n=1 Tax=Paenibacillus xerothermodurans TaxID=1977292 RepID=A0A2W1NGH9_PAEXE|nr:TRAP transporter large permease subunit [Paenibacillus xerothermodurans]PZE22790.1 L-dehydroascorbate transporter large permease subunit [Paenibacillus xerothermodurans]
MTLTVFVGSLLGAMALGMPIAFALLLSGVALMFYLGMFDTQVLIQSLIGGADSISLTAILFFILAGELMNAGGISKRIVAFVMALVGHIKGGMGYVVILGSVFFAGLSGSAVADTAALGAILIPMMVKSGYDRNQSTGLVAASGIIAPVIPPSIPMIVFGVTANVSITKLFLGGIVPGIMMAVGLAAVWWLLMRKKKIEPVPRKSLKEVVSTTVQAVWALLLPVIIIVGMRGGAFTPTEAGVVAVFYALFVGLFIYRDLKIQHLYHLFTSAAKTTSTVMFLAAAAMVSAWFITAADIPSQLVGILGPVMDNPLVLLLMINVLVFLVGTAMDLTPTILILTPVLMPVVVQAGIDPVYFGILFIINNVIGLLTPPVGTVLNVACGVGKTSMQGVMKGVWPFLVVHCLILLLLILFPQIVIQPIEFLSK